MCGTVVRVSQGTQSSGIEHVWDCCLSVRGYAVFRHTACVGLFLSVRGYAVFRHTACVGLAVTVV